MKQEIKKLEAIQELDKEIFTLSEEQESIPLEIKDSEDKVAAQETVVAEADDALKHKKVDLNEKELELKENEGLIQKYENQLNQVKTNKEYRALQSEIGNLKADNSIVEEDILKMMDKVQDEEASLNKEKEKLTELISARDSKKKELEEKVQENQKRIDELKVKKDELAKDVKPELLARYQRISDNRGGIGLSRIKKDEGLCGVCRIALRPQTINQVLKGDELIFCEACSRILYSDE